MPPNAVLRGGAFDGRQFFAADSEYQYRKNGATQYVYAPTGGHDEQVPNLWRYDLVREQPAE